MSLSIVGGIFWFVNRSITAVNTSTQNSKPALEEWQFAVIGDTEDMHPVTQRMLDDMQKQNIDFVVHLGDISSAGEAERMKEVRDAFAQLSVPTYYVPGNNDLIFDESLGERSSSVYDAVIQQPLNQYIEHNNARLLLLDNAYRKYGFRESMLTWLKTQLAEHTAPLYTFVFFHRPLHLPLEDIFGDDETPLSRTHNDSFLQILSGITVDYIFNGHIHLYIPYTVQNIPVVVSGGGGAYPQKILGGESAAYFHYLIVHVPNAEPRAAWIEVKKID